jgi:glyoxylase-like metal-dependent hydrolase (beta-lactamase superfamily II)
LEVPVEEGLKALGVQPEAVENVVLTHLHWDHAGNHDLFPRARYHVQEREARFCTGACMCHRFLRRPYSVEDVTAFVRKLYADRIQFHDGAEEIAPGITVHWVGGHARGLQVVRVRTRRGWVVLASDASHFYANIDQSRPFSLMVDAEDMCRATIRSCSRAIPGFMRMRRTSSGWMSIRLPREEAL